MDPISLAALSLGTGVANYFSKKGKKASVNMPNVTLPDYQASQYDAPAAGQLYSTLSDRVAGKNVGFAPEDINTMNEQAIDESAKAGNEFTNKAMAGQQRTGGMTKGGTNLIRNQALMYAGGLKSNALRDVGIKNAVQKRQEINAAIPQEQSFLQDERSQAQNLYNNKMQKTMAQYGIDMGVKEEADKVQAYNQSRQDSSNDFLFNTIQGGIGQYLNPSSGTSNSNYNPYAMYGNNSNVNSGSNQTGLNIGKLLSMLAGGK